MAKPSSSCTNRQYTFKDLLNDLTLLSMVPETMWGILKSSPTLERVHLWWLLEGQLQQQVSEGHWGWDSPKAKDFCQVALLFITLPVEANAECHYGLALVWCHHSQGRVGIYDGLKRLKDHDPMENCLQSS